jgi:arginase
MNFRTMQNRKDIYLLGYASSIAGPDPSAGKGPLVLQKSPYLMLLNDEGIHLHWHSMIATEEKTNILQTIVENNYSLANSVADLIADNKFFVVLGGDHTCAIGTWSGASHALEKKGDLGLIWIDAHMDSHTSQTSHTGNYHGMPLACLLGQGETTLTSILTSTPKIKPEHLCLIGIRSFEKEEEILLTELNVRIYYMDEIKRRGLHDIMQEALTIVTQGTAGFGISLDLDSIDPIDAPGTDVSVPDGIRAHELNSALQILSNNSRLLGIEITEFDPHRDIDHITEKLIPQLIRSIL